MSVYRTIGPLVTLVIRDFRPRTMIWVTWGVIRMILDFLTGDRYEFGLCMD